MNDPLENTRQIYRVLLGMNGPYFFGDESRTLFGNKQPYFRHSMALPAQATILGLVRKMIAVQSGISSWSDENIAPEKIQKAREFIGNSGYNPNIEGYGLIRYISPIALIYDQQRYFPAHHLYSGKDHQNPVRLGLDSTHQGELVSTIRNFNAKNGFLRGYYSPSIKGFVPESSILQRAVMTRNQKSHSGSGESDSFFKDEVIRYTSGVELEFFIQLENQQFEPESDFAIIGGDRRSCTLSIEKKATLPPDCPPNDEPSIPGEGWLVIADSYINANYRSICPLSWCESRHIRFQRSHITDPSFVDRDKLSKDTVPIVNAGALLIPIANTKPSALFCHPNSRNIGFNHFIRINLTS